MHPLRLNLLRKAFPENNCLSAISLNAFHDYQIPLGTPVILNSDIITPAIPLNVAENLRLCELGKINPDIRSGGYYYIGDQKGKRGKMSIAELATMTKEHTIDVLQHTITKIRLINLFPNRGDGWDHTPMTAQPKHVVYNPIKPLFWDAGYICEVDSIYGVMGSSVVNSIHSLLESYRYVSYCFSNFGKNRVSAVVKEIKRLIYDILTSFPVFKFYSCTEYNETYLLMDICGVSFFRLSDVIGVYDSKKANGMAMDVYASSTQIKDIADTPGANMLLRFIFNTDNENIDTIDGEKIVRWANKGNLEQGISFINAFLTKNSLNTVVKTVAVGG